MHSMPNMSAVTFHCCEVETVTTIVVSVMEMRERVTVETPDNRQHILKIQKLSSIILSEMNA